MVEEETGGEGKDEADQRCQEAHRMCFQAQSRNSEVCLLQKEREVEREYQGVE